MGKTHGSAILGVNLFETGDVLLCGGKFDHTKPIYVSLCMYK